MVFKICSVKKCYSECFLNIKNFKAIILYCMYILFIHLYLSIVIKINNILNLILNKNKSPLFIVRSITIILY